MGFLKLLVGLASGHLLGALNIGPEGPPSLLQSLIQAALFGLDARTMVRSHYPPARWAGSPRETSPPGTVPGRGREKGKPNVKTQ